MAKHPVELKTRSVKWWVDVLCRANVFYVMRETSLQWHGVPGPRRAFKVLDIRCSLTFILCQVYCPRTGDADMNNSMAVKLDMRSEKVTYTVSLRLHLIMGQVLIIR